MTEKSRWAPKIVAGLCVVGALLAIAHQTASNQPSAVPELVRKHEELGVQKAFVQPAARKNETVMRPPLAGPTRTAKPLIDLEQQTVQQVLASGGALLDGTRLGPATEADSAAWDAVSVQLEYRIQSPYWQGRMIPRMSEGWGCFAVAFDDLLNSATATILAGNDVMPDEQAIVAWAAARSYARGDSGTGLQLVQGIVRNDIANRRFYITDLQGLFEAGGGMDFGLGGGASESATVDLLLILDASGAPREPFAEVLRLLIDEAYPPERLAWLAEEASLGLQAGTLREARENEPRVGSTIPRDIQAWASFYAMRPLVLANTEKFLDAWRRGDGEAMAAAHRTMLRYSDMRVGPRISGEYRDYPAAAWKRAADCMAKAPRPAPLQMARFVAAAMLFRRDTGTWPRATEEIVPGYLPSGAIDAASKWGVEEVGPIATIISPEPWSSEFQQLSRFYYAAYDRAPQSTEDLAPFALPGTDVNRFAECFVTLPRRPIFYRLGPVDFCAASLTARLAVRRPNPGDPEEPSQVVWDAELLRRLESGEEKWKALDVVGFARVPPAGLLQLIGSGGGP